MTTIRPLRLALIFFVGVCTLAALKVSVAIPAKPQPRVAGDMIERDISLAPSLAKADKLEMSYTEVPAATPVQSIKIVMPVAAKPERAPLKIISRHWHVGEAIPPKRFRLGTKPKKNDRASKGEPVHMSEAH